MRTRHAALAAALLLAGCGGPLLFAELEIPAVGITLPSQTFPSVATALPVNLCSGSEPGCVQTELVYDIGQKVDLLKEASAKYELRLSQLSIALAATQAASDLGGVKSTVIEAVQPGATTGVVVASYYRSPQDPNPSAIAVSGNADLDLAKYLNDGKIDLRVKMTYDAPTPEFTADVQAVFYLKVTLDYGRGIGL